MSKNMLGLIPKLNEMERSWVVYFMNYPRDNPDLIVDCMFVDAALIKTWTENYLRRPIASHWLPPLKSLNRKLAKHLGVTDEK